MEYVLNEGLQLHAPGARETRITAERFGAEHVRVTYDSPLRACAAVEGVIKGAAREYGVKVETTQDQCALRGAARCVFEVRFHTPGPGDRPTV